MAPADPTAHRHSPARKGEEPDFPGRPLAQRAAALVLLAILGAGAWQAVGGITAPAAQQRLAGVLNAEAFLGGRTATAVNHVMAHDLPVDGALRMAGGVLRWMAFGAGGPQVWPGCDGWLFLTEELQPWPGGEAALARRIDLLRGVASRLAEDGIALQVAVVPDKARLLPAQRCGAPYSAQSAGRLPAAQRAIAAAGIPSADLVAALQAEAMASFYRVDTHWNQPGARRAAAAIADAAPGNFARESVFRTAIAEAETDGPGDLLRLMSLDRAPAALRPRQDRERLETTELAEEAAEASILDDAPAPEVVLIGSSYSLNANFHGALQAALRAPVGNLAQAGGGFAGAARAYFGSPAWQETPPRLVIWEMPERVLMQPLNADDAALAAWLAR